MSRALLPNTSCTVFLTVNHAAVGAGTFDAQERPKQPVEEHLQQDREGKGGIWVADKTGGM